MHRFSFKPAPRTPRAPWRHALVAIAVTASLAGAGSALTSGAGSGSGGDAEFARAADALQCLGEVPTEQPGGLEVARHERVGG